MIQSFTAFPWHYTACNIYTNYYKRNFPINKNTDILYCNFRSIFQCNYQCCIVIAFAKVAKTSQVSNYMFVTPFLMSIFGYLFLKEIPDIATLVGGTVILFGLFLFTFGWKNLSFIKINNRLIYYLKFIILPCKD